MFLNILIITSLAMRKKSDIILWNDIEKRQTCTKEYFFQQMHTTGLFVRISGMGCISNQYPTQLSSAKVLFRLLSILVLPTWSLVYYNTEQYVLFFEAEWKIWISASFGRLNLQ